MSLSSHENFAKPCLIAVCLCLGICLPSPFHSQVSIGTEPSSVFNEADWCLMIGAKPRGPGMERADLLQQNGEIFQIQVGCLPVCWEVLGPSMI